MLMRMLSHDVASLIRLNYAEEEEEEAVIPPPSLRGVEKRGGAVEVVLCRASW